MPSLAIYQAHQVLTGMLVHGVLAAYFKLVFTVVSSSFVLYYRDEFDA